MVVAVLVSSLLLVLAGGELVRTVHDDDPVLRAVLEQEGPDWRPLALDLTCPPQESRLSDFCHRAIQLNQGCVHAKVPSVVVVMLSHCRRECRDFYSSLPESHLDWDILEHGGFEDLLPQPFGFQLPVCCLREGYHHAQMVAKQVDFVKQIPELTRFVPAFTDIGFLKTKVPESLFQDIVAARDLAITSGMISAEEPDFGILNGPVAIENPISEKCKDITVPRTQLIKIGTDIKKSVLESLGPLAEDWAQLKLRPSSLYGIRRYLNMSTLLAHVDKVGSHVISAIINVGQEVEEDWPLFIKDNMGQEHTVMMEPGDMVWYESARMVSTL